MRREVEVALVFVVVAAFSPILFFPSSQSFDLTALNLSGLPLAAVTRERLQPESVRSRPASHRQIRWFTYQAGHSGCGQSCGDHVEIEVFRPAANGCCGYIATFWHNRDSRQVFGWIRKHVATEILADVQGRVRRAIGDWLVGDLYQELEVATAGGPERAGGFTPGSAISPVVVDIVAGAGGDSQVATMIQLCPRSEGDHLHLHMHNLGFKTAAEREFFTPVAVGAHARAAAK